MLLSDKCPANSIFLPAKVPAKHISCRTLVRQSSDKAYIYRQNMLCRTFLRQKLLNKVPAKSKIVDKICFVGHSSGKNMLCRTFLLNKMSGKIILSTNICFPGRQAQAAGLPAGRPSRPAQNHTVDKYMLSGPAGLGGRAAYIIQSTVF